MTAHGFNWGAWAFGDASAADIDATALNDGSTLTSDEISLDNLAACEIAVSCVEDNTGACDGNVYIYLLGQGATAWQTADDDLVPIAVIQ